MFKYELCSHPLFDTSLLLFQQQKRVLADANWALLTPILPESTDQVQYMLDGGALVQHIPWTHGPTAMQSATYTGNMSQESMER